MLFMLPLQLTDYHMCSVLPHAFGVGVDLGPGASKMSLLWQKPTAGTTSIVRMS